MPSTSVLRRTARATAFAAVGLALASTTTPAGTTSAARVSAHLTGSDAVSTAVATVVPGVSYAFTATFAGKPVRWNPCTAIHWRSNTSRGPAGGLDVIKAAVASVSGATATQWVYDGPTSTVPRVGVLRTTTTAPQAVVIGWTDAASSDLLAGRSASTAGMTRTVWFSTGTVAATRGAVVALNRASRIPLRGGVSWQTAITHELGHVVGLAHARAAAEVMAPVLSTGIALLQPGDRAGLARVGRQAGCVPFPG